MASSNETMTGAKRHQVPTESEGTPAEERKDVQAEERKGLGTEERKDVQDEAKSPPQLQHSRRGGFMSGKVKLTRDVGVNEAPWLNETLSAGTVLQVYTGHAYGLISNSGIPVTFNNHSDASFFEVP